MTRSLPLIEKLRSTIRADPTVIENDAASLNVTDLVVLAGRPAIASVVPIVSDSGEIEQAAGTEPLHISVRFLDGSFLDAVMQQYLIEGARFSWDDNAASGEATIPLADNAGKPIGYFVWQPDRPGWRLLSRMAPFLLGALLIVALIIALLVLRLKRASTELLASEAQAQHLAFHDPLTGLANRALFSDRLDRALIESRKTGQRLALLYLDLDRFKNVNDTLGHPAGDDLIRELAQRLSALVRSTDCVSRLGGDEFAIIQAKVGGHEDVAALCERIIQTVASPFDILDSTAFVGISIGVAIAPEAGVDRAELVRKADIALYRAKLEGRNRFRIFQDEMDATIQRRRAIEAELRDALAAGDQFQLVYQPLFANDAKHLVGVEALLRWNHPVHGLLSPATFVPIAEESGLIQDIGEWVLWEACRKAVGWPIRRIAVNVSPVQFRTARFAARVHGDPCRDGTGALEAGAGDHRKRALELGRDVDADLQHAARGGREDRARRFRHRLFLVELPAQIRRRQDQDRPLLRAEPRYGQGLRRHRAGHGGPCPRHAASTSPRRAWKRRRSATSCSPSAATSCRVFCSRGR